MHPLTSFVLINKPPVMGWTIWDFYYYYIIIMHVGDHTWF